MVILLNSRHDIKKGGSVVFLSASLQSAGQQRDPGELSETGGQ